jgi:hypothetical protein
MWSVASREMSSYVSSHRDELMKEVEALVLLFTSVMDSKSWKGVLAAVLSYVKSHYSTSLSSVILQCISDLFEIADLRNHIAKCNTADEILSGMDCQSEETSMEAEWLKTLRTANSNWKLATQNEGFEKVSKLLSLLIGAGIVNMTSINPEVGGFKLFSELSVPKHVSCYDMTDAFLSTIVFFVEGGYESFRTGSIKPLLYGEHEMRQFDEKYLQCRKYADYARPGNLSILSIDENDLEKMYSDTIDLGKRIAKTVKSSLVKKQLQDRVTKLQDLHSTFVQYRQTGGIREKPYCIGIYGKSSVGKSTIGPLLMVSSLVYNGFRADDEAMIVLNEHDKYMSNYKSSIQGVFLDDVGNTKSDFVETAPTVRILEMVNNVKMYANMAEAELKGKVSIQPKVVVCTTNVKDFCAHTYSNEPVSIARRANIIVTATVRPQFATNNMLDERKVFEFYGDEPPQIPDLWQFHVEKAYPIASKVKNQADTIGWKTLIWNGMLMEKIDMPTLMRFVNADSQMHFAHQRKIVNNNSHLAQKLTFCKDCRAHTDLCTCDDDGQHEVAYIDSPYVPGPSQSKKRGPFGRPVPNRRIHFSNQAGEIVGDAWASIYSRLESLSNPIIDRFMSWTPAWFFQNRWIRYAYAFSYGHYSRSLVYLAICCATTFLLILGALLPWTVFNLVWLFFILSASYLYLWCCEYQLLIETARDTTLGERLARCEMQSKIKYILAGSALLTAAYYVCRNARDTRSVFCNQGMMHPTMADIKNRDENDLTETVKKEMNWANVHLTPIPVTKKARTTTASDLKAMVRNNLTHMTATINGKQYGCDAFFLCSNVAIIPRHVWKCGEMLCKFTRHEPSRIGGNFTSFISKVHSVDVPDMDMSLIWVPNGGSWKDMRDYFPLSRPTTPIPTEFIWKNHEGICRTSQTLFTPCQTSNRFMKFFGGEYNLTFPTEVGFCMGTHVAETKAPFIAGLHLGGVTGKTRGGAGTVTRQQLELALQQLEQIPSVLLSTSSGTYETEKYGVQFFEKPEIHEKSPVRKLPIVDGKTPNIQVFGSCQGRVKYFSEVEKSCISDIVEEVCGVPNQWGPPKFSKGDAWEKSLQHSCQPSHGIEGSLLSRACDDYMKPFSDLLTEYHALREATKPLTKMETICGIDGKKFIDKMPPNTSVGYPLSGPKRDHLTYLDPSMFEGFNCPAELDDIFWQEFEKAKTAYLSGERYYATFKACLKDEPTPVSKDKVRVFQAAPIVLQMMTRMYYLPIARILSLFPALSECAVGVNCMGPDWSELSDHMCTFGKDRILAGDYSKYDLRMPAQIMFSAFRIMIELSKICGYSKEDITIMKGIATDICYPVMAYNGDLIQHIGSNPSGQNLTVYINSLVNSLLFRCAFFSLNGVRSKLDFRDVCKLMTYGDDVKGSVKKGHDKFNHIYCAEFFAKHDMKFTMPDKESAPIPFMNDSDADFLKRKNVFCHELGFTMGALDEKSIWKSLHSNLKSKVLTNQQVAGQNIDGALREWMNHGRDVYEQRREQMRSVAEKAGITHLCHLLDCTYDQMIARWRTRYLYDGDEEEEEPEEVFDIQAGEYEPSYTEYMSVTRQAFLQSEDEPLEDRQRFMTDHINATFDTDFEDLYEFAQLMLDHAYIIDAFTIAPVVATLMLLYGVVFRDLYYQLVLRSLPSAAAAAHQFCGDEFIPYSVSIYEHCNGSLGIFPVERYAPLFNVCIGLPIQIYFGRCVLNGRVRFVPTTMRYYHYVFIYMLINFGGVFWLYNQLWMVFSAIMMAALPEMFTAALEAIDNF